MITGTVLEPFIHDSTWPDEELVLFRRAVYYFHVHVPGRDPIAILRELAEKKLWKDDDEWKCIKRTCNKIIHLAIRDVSDSGLTSLVKNLLIFTNIILIHEHGYKPMSVCTLRTNDPQKEKEEEKVSEAARKKYIKAIGHAYKSLEDSVNSLNRKNRGLLDLEGSRLLTPLPFGIPFISIEPEDEIRLEIEIDPEPSDRCNYHFRPDHPIGWVMTGGNLTKDKFVDDVTSSEGIRGL